MRINIPLEALGTKNDLNISPLLVNMTYEDRVKLAEVIYMNKFQQAEARYKNKIGQLNNDKCKRYYVRVNGRLIKKANYNDLINAIIQEENRVSEVASVISLNSILDDFLAYRRSTVSAGTYRDDIQFFETYIRFSPIGDMNIKDIRQKDLVKWADYCFEKKPDMREKYFKNIRSVLSSMFIYCGENYGEFKNIVCDFCVHRDRFIPKKRTPDQDRIFSDDELRRLMPIIYADAADDAIPYGLIVLFNTGIRDCELCALHWRDINELGCPNTIHIQEEMVEESDINGKFCGYKLVNHTKTPAGNRFVPISPELSKVLEKVKKLNQEKGLPTGPDDFVFLRRRKGEIKECTCRCFESRLKKYCKKAGMETLKSQHDIRRTFATMLYYDGMPKKSIQKYMGHSSLKQTEDYIHIRDIDDEEKYIANISKRWNTVEQS